MKREHGGNLRHLARVSGRAVENILDFSANINPLGPPESLGEIISRNLGDLIHYPDPYAAGFTRAVAEYHGVEAQRVVAGNGSSELLFLLPRVHRGKRAVIPVPSYIDYTRACEAAGLEVLRLYQEPRRGFEIDLQQLHKRVAPGDLVILGQPANPAGTLCDREELLELARAHPRALFLIDEAFGGFVPGYRSLAGEEKNIVVLVSLTKIYAVPGLRLGYLVAGEEICSRLREILAPWSVNTLSQEVGIHFLREEEEYRRRSCKEIETLRREMQRRLAPLPGLKVFAGRANFLLCRLEKDGDDQPAALLADRLLKRDGIGLRVCDNYDGLNGRYFRVAVRNAGENRRLAAALSRELAPASAGSGRRSTGRPRAKTLMLQGTGSDVGKSVLAAALCRIFLREGVKVAPFKAQNMSLNSFVTRDGGEMGRAQVVQAQACRLDPEVRMNPVLLKPASDVGCQVIVNGRPVGNMLVGEYIRYKPQAFAAACRAFDSLAAEYDVVILEGAGSPGEINLKSHDIVNMKMAAHAGSPVLLVGDIDRGGVYASFIGHLEVMALWERELLAGFVVNRFRGDASLLEDAHISLERRTGLPVLGVVPHISELGIPQEDSVGFKSGLFEKKAASDPHVCIAVIDLPHISNFTDVEPFLDEPDVELRIVGQPEQLEGVHAVILPGSKNVMKDLEFLVGSGLADAVVSLGAGVEIVGICGGYQMLGKGISDPHRLEAGGGRTTVKGLGLLDMHTELSLDKTLTRRSGFHRESGCAVHGYEIHHGRSESGEEPVLSFSDGSGCGRRGGDFVWGSYLHGIFDADEFRRWFIDRLRTRNGLGKLGRIAAPYDLEPAFERLAETVRRSLDMDAVFRIVGL